MCIDGDLSFASYYGDHMVLKKSPEKAVLWGYGPEGEQVTVFLSGPIKQKTSPVTVTKGKYSCCQVGSLCQNMQGTGLEIMSNLVILKAAETSFCTRASVVQLLL